MLPTFDPCDFEAMRDWIKTLPYESRKIETLLNDFDNLRYGEEYELIYELLNILNSFADLIKR